MEGGKGGGEGKAQIGLGKGTFPNLSQPNSLNKSPKVTNAASEPLGLFLVDFNRKFGQFLVEMGEEG